MLNQTPAIAPHLDVLNRPEIKEVLLEVDKRQKVVFYPGSFMTIDQTALYGFHLGGKLFPARMTVPNNYLVRCQFTPLKEAMMSVRTSLIDPKERKNYIKAYTATQIWNPAAMAFENVTVGAGGMSKGLLFKKLYPSQEIGQIVGDGVIEIAGLDEVSDIREAQLFFFPEWRSFLMNLKAFPTTLRALRDQLAERLEQTTSLDMQQIGVQVLRACDEFRRFGTKYIAHQSLAIKQAEKTDGIQTYDEIGESFFQMLELKRQDTLIQDFVKDQQAALAGAGSSAEQMSLLTTLVTQLSTLVMNQQGFNAAGAPAQSSPPLQTAASADVKAPVSPLAAAFDAPPANSSVADEIEADGTEADDETEETTEKSAELTAEIVAAGCSDTTKAGTACKGQVQKVIDGKGFCNNHPRVTAEVE